MVWKNIFKNLLKFHPKYMLFTWVKFPGQVTQDCLPIEYTGGGVSSMTWKGSGYWEESLGVRGGDRSPSTGRKIVIFNQTEKDLKV